MAVEEGESGAGAGAEAQQQPQAELEAEGGSEQQISEADATKGFGLPGPGVCCSREGHAGRACTLCMDGIWGRATRPHTAAAHADACRRPGGPSGGGGATG